MKKIVITICAILLLFAGCGKTRNLEKDKIVAINATSYFQNRKDNDFYILLDSNAKNNITLEQLSEEFDDIVKVYGQPVEFDSEEVQAIEREANAIVSVPVLFESGWMDVTYTINSTSSVINFKITASDKLDENGYNETQYVYKTSNGEGKAVFTNTKGSEKTPLVILVHDQGYLDKNSTVGVRKVFRDLAYALADKGIASVRYDRTNLDNDDIEDSIALMQEELLAVYESCKNFEEIDNNRIYVLGYGVGGYLLPKLVERMDIDGLIIASSPCMDLHQSIYEKQMYEVECEVTMSEQNKKVRRKEIEASRDLIETLVNPEDFYQDIFGYSSSFWIQLQSYDAIQTVENLNLPVLITQGSNDYEVSSNAYNQWQHGLKDSKLVSLKYYKNMDHLFTIRNSTSVPADCLSESTIADAFVNDISKFVQK